MLVFNTESAIHASSSLLAAGWAQQLTFAHTHRHCNMIVHALNPNKCVVTVHDTNQTHVMVSVLLERYCLQPAVCSGSSAHYAAVCRQ
jgi:hypothetical protein